MRSGRCSPITGTEVDPTFTLFPPLYMDFGKNLNVGKNVLIQQFCTFFDRCGITIGDNSIAGANSVVTHDVPSNSIVVESPARKIGEVPHD